MLSNCPNCGKKFNAIRSQKYCGDECREIARKKRDSWHREVRICKYCGESYTPTSGKQMYCCKEHTFKGLYLENADEKKQKSRDYRLKNIDAIRAKDRERNAKRKDYKKEYDERYHDKTNFSGNRHIAFERDEHKCSECGSKIGLSGHHIDGSGQTENRNDEPDNLQILCNSCHGKKQLGIPKKPEVHLTVTCQGCGIEFDTTQERIDSGRGKFHSKECAYKNRAEKITLICQHCGIEFSVTPSRLKRGYVKYHNAECRKAAGYAWTKQN